VGLRKYFAKRRFNETPEPKGKPKKAKSKKLAFVVQEHHASSLHYDFRLELDGVLKSWAVPKGPSMNPHDRHLAMHVEDHPFEYRKFEGTIPEGNYGAGNVIIWDEGTYEPYHDGPDDEATLRKELKKGHLTFFLHGKKLQGEFALIKMHGDDDKAWLLIKKGDQFASTKDITKQDESVKSGKKVDDLDTEHPDVSKYPAKKHPWRVKPMLATLVGAPFSKEGWLFEIKWDGYRAIASKNGGDIELYSRMHTDFKTHYPAVAEAIRKLKHNVILDGEIMVMDDEGVPHFELLQNWRKDQKGHLYYYVFDILWYDGRDLRDMPLAGRKEILKSIVPTNSLIRYSDHIETKGSVLFEEMKKKGLEGIIAKQADSPYRENNRGSSWLKIKTQLRQEVVIGGFTEPRGGRKYLGSLLVGVYDKGDFVYTGHSGGGIPDNQRKLLREKLDKLERKVSPFAIQPKPNAPVHWVKPELVVEMSFTEWTNDGRMRHPAFEGLRADKKPIDVHREKPKAVAPIKEEMAMKKGKVEFTHSDKVFFPKHGYTKGDIAAYYESVAKYILPYIKDRPLSLNRQPHGITGEGFFQKNMEHLPDWVPHKDIFSESNNKDLHWMVGGDLDTLLYMVQLGCVEINPWNARVQHLDKPDWLVIDLDPEGVTFKDVVSVAQTVKEVCDEWKVTALPKTSGKTGIHVYIPLGARYEHEQAKNFAHLIALEVNKRQPKLTSVERMPNKRKNRIYLDFLQNREGQTLAAPYSLRPTPDASVSTPLHWDDVTPNLKPTDFTIKNMAKRLDKVGDLWKPVFGKGVDIGKILKTLEK
jgi:bifunctional non-homologous end joining protein LigD